MEDAVRERLGVGEPEGVEEGLLEDVTDRVSLCVRVLEDVRLPDCVDVCEGELVGEAERVLLPLLVCEGLPDGEGVLLLLRDSVPDSVVD